jgi:hypothetical protein
MICAVAWLPSIQSTPWCLSHSSPQGYRRRRVVGAGDDDAVVFVFVFVVVVVVVVVFDLLKTPCCWR